MAFSLRSPSFEPQGAIPAKHTCQGDDASPALTWSDAPAGTKSFALIVDDPDAPDPRAPKTTWVHWVLYNLPRHGGALPEARDGGDLPAGTREGHQRLEAHRLRRAVPADRAAPLLPQALRAGRRARRSAQADQGGAGEGDARPRARRGAAGRDVREESLATGSWLAWARSRWLWLLEQRTQVPAELLAALEGRQRAPDVAQVGLRPAHPLGVVARLAHAHPA